mgnify:CR=1 FL=1
MRKPRPTGRTEPGAADPQQKENNMSKLTAKTREALTNIANLGA